MSKIQYPELLEQARRIVIATKSDHEMRAFDYCPCCGYDGLWSGDFLDSVCDVYRMLLAPICSELSEHYMTQCGLDDFVANIGPLISRDSPFTHDGADIYIKDDTINKLQSEVETMRVDMEMMRDRLQHER